MRTCIVRAAALLALAFWAIAMPFGALVRAESHDSAPRTTLKPWTDTAPSPVALPQFGAVPAATFSVAAIKADAIVLHFFASWCEPCREELPALQRLADRGAPRLKLVAVAVADNDFRLRRLIEETGITFPVLLDGDRGTARTWSIAALPSTVILDSQHRPRLLAETDLDWDKIEPSALIDRVSQPTQNIRAQHVSQQ